jgi:hypothetical protein
VGNDLEDMHCTKATEPERVGSPDTHLLILLGRKRGQVSDPAMPTVRSNLALDTARPPASLSPRGATDGGTLLLGTGERRHRKAVNKRRGR